MTEQNKSAAKICLNFGLLISGALIAASFILVKNESSILINSDLDSINYMICISGLFMTIRKLRSDILPFITYWQSTLAGLLTISIAAIPFSIFLYFVLSTYPEIISNAIAITEKTFKANDIIGEETNTFLSLYKALATPAFMTFGNFINKIIMGFFFSLILSSFLSRKKYLPNNNNSTNFDDKEQ